MLFVGKSQSYASSDPNVRFFADTKAMEYAVQAKSEQEKWSNPREGMTTMLYTFQSHYCDEMLSSTELIKEIRDADLIVGELLYLCASLVADELSLPLVIIGASSLSTPTGIALGLPFTPSYVPQWDMQLPREWSLLDRARNLLQWMKLYDLYSSTLCSIYGKIKAKHNITPDKSIQETLGRVDLIIGQMPFGLEHPRPLNPNTRVVGPFLPSPPKPLPDELEQFVQSAGDEGVILVSFGTIMGVYRTIEEKMLQMMAKAFSKLPQKVIWKLKLEGTSKFSVSDNVKLLPWLPQNDILGHPKTRLFIGHAGLNGILESIYHGVPLICSPFFADQFDNAHTAKRTGFAETLDLGTATSEELVSLIHKVLNHSSYRESAARISKSVKMLPRPPIKEAADWVEYTLALGGLPHLRPRGLDLPFYQLYFLDILLLVLSMMFVSLLVIKILLKGVMRSLSGSSNKEKRN